MHAPLQVQPKLEIGRPGDRYEQEADAVADHVVSGSSAPNLQMIGSGKYNLQMSPLPSNPVVQRYGDEEEESIQMKCEECEKEESIQKKSAIQKSGDGKSYASADVTSELRASKGKGQALPKGVREEIGSKMGADLSGVRIHTDTQAVQMSHDLGAKAFTNGQDVYFNKGQYNPSSSEGKHLLAHELTHTVQQGGPGIQRQIPETDKTPQEMLEVIKAHRQGAPYAAEYTDIELKEMARKVLIASYAHEIELTPNEERLLTDMVSGIDSEVVLEEEKEQEEPADNNKYHKCDASLKSILKQRHSTAVTQVALAAQRLGELITELEKGTRPSALPPVLQSCYGNTYSRFKNPTIEDLKKIHKNFQKLSTKVSAGLNFKCEDRLRAGCKRGTEHGFVNRASLIFTNVGRIHICKNAFLAESPYQQARVVIHEASHRHIQVRDKAYIGVPGSRFWRINTKQAVNNADSYAYFAMDVV